MEMTVKTATKIHNIAWAVGVCFSPGLGVGFNLLGISLGYQYDAYPDEWIAALLLLSPLAICPLGLALYLSTAHWRAGYARPMFIAIAGLRISGLSTIAGLFFYMGTVPLVCMFFMSIESFLRGEMFTQVFTLEN